MHFKTLRSGRHGEQMVSYLSLSSNCEKSFNKLIQIPIRILLEELLRPLSNNTNIPCQCSHSLIYAHTVTTALSDCLSEPPHMAVI